MNKDSDKTKEQLIAELAELRRKNKEQENKLKATNQQLGNKNKHDYKTLFDESPVPTWEEDFSQCKIYIDSLKKRGIKNFRKYFAKNPKEVLELSKKVKIIAVNEAAVKLHEAQSKQEILHSLSSIFTDKSYEIFAEELICIAEGKKEYESEIILKTIAGLEKNILLKWRVVPGYEDTLERVCITTADITERKRAEKKLKEKEIFLKTIFDGIQEPMHVIDRDYKVLLTNKKLLKMKHIKQEDIRGKYCYEAYQGRNEHCEQCGAKEVFKTGKPYSLIKYLPLPDGTYGYFEVYSFPLLEENGEVGQVIEMTRDITNRKQAEEELKKNVKKYRELSTLMRLMADDMPDMVWAKNLNKEYIFVNKAICTGLLNAKDTDEPLGKTDMFFAERERNAHPDNLQWHTFGEVCRDSDAATFEARKPMHFDEFGNVRGKFLFLDVHKAPLYDSNGQLIGTVGSARDVTEIKKTEKELEKSEAKFHSFAQTASDAIVSTDSSGKIMIWNHSAEQMFGYSAKEILGKPVTLLMPERFQEVHQKGFNRVISGGNTKLIGKTVEVIGIRKNGQEFPIELSLSKWEIGDKLYVSAIIRDITERKQTEEKLNNKIQMLSWLYGAANSFTQALDVSVIAKETVRLCVEAFGATLAWLGYAEEDGSVRVLAHYPENISYPTEISVRWDETKEGQGPTGKAIKEGKSQICNDTHSNPSFAIWREKAVDAGIRSSVALPMITRNRVFGALNLYSDKSGYFTTNQIQYLQSFAHMAANALENARLYEETNRRMQRIQALRNIDMVITGALDLQIVYKIALEEITTQLDIDAACIIIHNTYDNTLGVVAERGFMHTFGNTILNYKTTAGKVFREQKIVHIADLRKVSMDNSSIHNLMLRERFISYYGVPLVAKGRLLGVLEVYHRKLRDDDNEWIEYLKTLGGQVAIAIENATLIDNLRLKHMDLLDAYNETLEGWGKALYLKEEETEQHSKRVTRMTVEIAKKMGIRGKDLIHVRRGALLHDIGKIGIPDSILLKPGKLTEEEWKIMKKHTVYAFEMLSPISYLRQAIYIPYCHHEKWDGTGYPRGLKGKQIPLSARIFAVVDVWDALISDRPYRKAWPKDKVVRYIKEQSGKHFDPEVVGEFLKYISEELKK